MMPPSVSAAGGVIFIKAKFWIGESGLVNVKPSRLYVVDLSWD